MTSAKLQTAQVVTNASCVIIIVKVTVCLICATLFCISQYNFVFILKSVTEIFYS